MISGIDYHLLLTYCEGMHLIKRTDAPRFDAAGTAVTAYAAPSRGSSELSVWQIELTPGSTSPLHHMDREEVFLGLEGHAIAEIGNSQHSLGAGDCLILPAGTDFTLHVADEERPFRALACVPAGAQATMVPDGATFVPPWAE
jgi:quercetin dioxygenase-like cupin family protein